MIIDSESEKRKFWDEVEHGRVSHCTLCEKFGIDYHYELERMADERLAAGESDDIRHNDGCWPDKYHV